MALHLRTVSPIVMVHGANADASTWTEEGDAGLGETMGFAQFLEEIGWPIDGCGTGPSDASQPQAAPCFHRIDLDPANASRRVLEPLLADSLRKISAELGVKGLHLVTISSGGILARAYLSGSSYLSEEGFKVRSLTTLAAGHNGIEFADLAIGTAQIVAKLAGVKSGTTQSWKDSARDIAAEVLASEVNVEMSTAVMTEFNRATLSSLPEDTIYFAYAGSADRREPFQLIDADETRAFYRFDALGLSDPARAIWGTSLYHLIGSLGRIGFTPWFWCISPMNCFPSPIFPLTISSSEPNDLVVRVSSALGEEDGFARHTRLREVFGGNHSSIRRKAVAAGVASVLRHLEEEEGGLR
jgi:pimeloyl-ACP methyl ester carboxylesterase